MPSSTDVSRRRLLAAGAAGAATAISGCNAITGPNARFDAWTPGEGEWPLARYGPRNAGHNPHAAPRRDGVAEGWRRSLDVDARGLLVTPDYVVAHGRRGARFVDRRHVRRPRVVETPAFVGGVAPPGEYGNRTVYLAGSAGGTGETTMGLVRGWLVGGDDPQPTFWTTYEEGNLLQSLLPSPNALYLGSRASGEVTALGTGGGAVRWRDRGVHAALADGRLYASARYRLCAYEPRSGLDDVGNGGPRTVWSASDGRMGTPPAVADGRVLVGDEFEPGRRGALRGYDAATGEPLWEGVELGANVSSPAVVGETAYAGASGENWRSGALVAVDLRDGSIRWRRETDWWHHAPVAAGSDTVVAFGAVREGDPGEGPGKVRAYDAETGESLWTFTTDSPADAVALVGRTVFVGTRAGRVHALS